MNKIIVLGLALVSLVTGLFSSHKFGTLPGSFWTLNGLALSPINSSYTLATSTTPIATGYFNNIVISGNCSGQGCTVASSTQVGTLQQVTNLGNSTTNTIQFAGGTATAPFSVTDNVNFGSGFFWDNINNVASVTSSNSFGTSSMMLGDFSRVQDPLALGTTRKQLGLEAVYVSSTTATPLSIQGISALYQHSLFGDSNLIGSAFGGSFTIAPGDSSSHVFGGLAGGASYNVILDGRNFGLDASSTNLVGNNFAHARGNTMGVIMRRGVTTNYAVGMDGQITTQFANGYATTTVGEADAVIADVSVATSSVFGTLRGFHAIPFNKWFGGGATATTTYAAQFDDPGMGTTAWTVGSTGRFNYFSGKTSFGSSNVPTSTVAVDNGDIEITSSTRGIIMHSPNGSCFRTTVSNAGSLVTASISCP